MADAQQKYQRAKDLAAKQLIARSDLDAAKVAVDLAEATVRSIRAQVVQAQAAVNQAQLNLDHTIITSPIDGIVIGRSVDAGQTVAASLSSPTVFSIAADLAEMQVNASIDESDIGRIRPGAAGHLPGGRLPERALHRHGRAGPAAAERRAERDDLQRDHRRPESRR